MMLTSLPKAVVSHRLCLCPPREQLIVYHIARTAHRPFGPRHGTTAPSPCVRNLLLMCTRLYHYPIRTIPYGTYLPPYHNSTVLAKPNTATKMKLNFRFLSLFLACLATASAFTTLRTTSNKGLTKVTPTKVEPAFLFKKPDEDEDLSFLEVRDMTREEMAQLNAENERVMNAELWGMTLFSLILSLPMFYLVWVGFFSETAEMNLDM